nr:PREDICTED: espin-like [Bemisia tabaci]
MCSKHASEYHSSDLEHLTVVENLRYDQINVGKWLLEWDNGMPALERSSNGALALHYAAARGCLDCVKLLAQSSPELSANTQMDNDVTPVYLAAQEGHLEVLKFLVLEAGGSLYVRAKDGMAPVHAAAQMGCLSCLKWMVQDQGVDPNLRDGDGATPLHFSASRGHLECVRWLLRHGAKLVTDKYGKSPINDAAENHQMECLSMLVQHGTSPDYQDERGKLHGCLCRKEDPSMRCSYADCVNCDSNPEPFYLHDPPKNNRDGLFINPMAENEASESFFLHDPQQVPYNRVKDLFANKPQGFSQAAPKLSVPQTQSTGVTVKVEVHSSSSGAGSEENTSCSEGSERGDHDYEDIYSVRDRDKKGQGAGQGRAESQDSGSHSRSGSLSSENSNLVVQVGPAGPLGSRPPEPEPPKDFLDSPQDGQVSAESGVSSGSPSDLGHSEEENEKCKHERLSRTHCFTLPHNNQNNRALKRVVSEPGGMCPPPPPPPPPDMISSTISSNHSNQGASSDQSRPFNSSSSNASNGDDVSLASNSYVEDTTASYGTLDGSEPSTALAASENGDASPVGHGPHLVNKQMVLPFIPPKFPSNSADSNSLIKPSEYLRSISISGSKLQRSTSDLNIAIIEEIKVPAVTLEKFEEETITIGPGGCPPPPPLPLPSQDTQAAARKQHQPLSTISIHDLSSVQLKKTLATKTMSAPPIRSTGTEQPFKAAKEDLIAELKLSKDITGIKKMKVERVKQEKLSEKEAISEINRQFSIDAFVEKIPEKDGNGNPIPPWKRQMLAKKAAEKARREKEEQLVREAEEKRLQAIPAWKRQLLQSRAANDRSNTSVPTIHPKIITPPCEFPHSLVKKCNEEAVSSPHLNSNTPASPAQAPQVEDNNNKENSEPAGNQNDTKTPVKEESDENQDTPAQIIPWRAQLRKTNSTLNLLE